jgi:hypothetical protein
MDSRETCSLGRTWISLADAEYSLFSSPPPAGLEALSLLNEPVSLGSTAFNLPCCVAADGPQGSERAVILGSEAGSAILGSEGAVILGSEGAAVLGSEGAAVLGSEGAAVLGSEGAAVLGSEGAVVLGSEGAVCLCVLKASVFSCLLTESCSASFRNLQK